LILQATGRNVPLKTVKKLAYLRILVEMWIFNSLLLLIKTTSSTVYGGKESVRRELKHKFIDLLKTGDKLP